MVSTNKQANNPPKERKSMLYSKKQGNAQDYIKKWQQPLPHPVNLPILLTTGGEQCAYSSTNCVCQQWHTHTHTSIATHRDLCNKLTCLGTCYTRLHMAFVTYNPTLIVPCVLMEDDCVHVNNMPWDLPWHGCSCHCLNSESEEGKDTNSCAIIQELSLQ